MITRNKINFKTGIMKLIHYLHKHRAGYLLILLTVFVSSCFKEVPTEIPKVLRLKIKPDSIIAGNTAIMCVKALDADNNHLYYHWTSQDGTFLTSSEEPSVAWVAPFKEGSTSCSIQVSDGKVVTSKTLHVNVFGYLMDSFDYRLPIWRKKNCNVFYEKGKAAIIKGTASDDGIYFADLPYSVSPPFAIHMKIGRREEDRPLSFLDKYGLYMNFKNIASDTLVKAIWFRIYPASVSKNWRLTVMKDVGDKSAWQNLDNFSQGSSNKIKTRPGDENLIKIVVDKELIFHVFLNDSQFFSTSALRDNYLSGGIPPRLILEQVGARTSNTEIFIDDTFITHNTELQTNDIFKK